MKNCIYEPVFGLFLLFNFQIESALTFSSRLNYIILTRNNHDQMTTVLKVIIPFML